MYVYHINLITDTLPLFRGGWVYFQLCQKDRTTEARNLPNGHACTYLSLTIVSPTIEHIPLIVISPLLITCIDYSTHLQISFEQLLLLPLRCWLYLSRKSQRIPRRVHNCAYSYSESVGHRLLPYLRAPVPISLMCICKLFLVVCRLCLLCPTA